MKFEWQKWQKLPKNRVVMVIILIVISGLLFSIEKEFQSEYDNYLIHLRENNGQFLMNQVDTMTGFIAEAPDLPLAERERLTELYMQAYDQLDRYYMSIKNQKEQMGQDDYLGYLQTLKEIESLGMGIPVLVDESLELSEAKMTYLMAHELVNEKSMSQPTGLRLLLECLLVIMSIGGSLCFLLLFYDWFTWEYEHQQIRLIYTQPIKRSHLTRNKLLVVASIYVGLILFCCLASLTWGRIRSGEWGSFQEPVMVYHMEKQIEIFTIGHLLMYLCIYSFISISVLILGLVVISYWLRKSIPTLLLTSILIGGPLSIGQRMVPDEWLRVTPLYSFKFSSEYEKLIKEGQLGRQTIVAISLVLLLYGVAIFLGKSHLKWLNKEKSSL